MNKNVLPKEESSIGMPAQVLAVVLNWNEPELTLRCIRSLIAQEGVDLEILIVDNNSDVDPTDKILSEFHNVKVIRNKANYGVAGGRNVGIKYALKLDFQFILFFDNDAYADSEMLVNLVDSANQNPDLGILGPKIFVDGKTNVIWRAGCTSWKWTYLHAGYMISKRLFAIINKPFPLLLDTLRGENQIDVGQYDEQIDIDFQIGCAQLIRTEVFRNVGLLDEQFSPYGSEDIDFCARVTKAGWRIRYVSDAICWHRVIGSFQNEYQRAFHNLKNLLILSRKHLSPFYFWLLFVPDFICLHIPLIIFENILHKKQPRNKAIIDAIRWNMRDIVRRGIFI